RARRQLVEALAEAAKKTRETSSSVSAQSLTAALDLSTRPVPPPGLFVLCRTEAQAHAALDAGADGVWLDFLALTGVANAVNGLRARAGARAFVGVAPPRIRKPGEEKITKFLAGLDVDGTLVRGLGPLHELAQLQAAGTKPDQVFVGDFSLNVSNRLTVNEVLSRGVSAFTPSYDLDEAQLEALLSSDAGPHAELVIHQPMPLFHTEHCVFAALLSDGKGHDYKTCGRPCESHQVALRDRAGLVHPVEADVGCRNTVFHERAQSAAQLVAGARRAGVGRYRIELVREDAAAVVDLVGAYKALLDGSASAKTTLKRLKTAGGYGVVKGSLRVLEQDAA
ncbi:MAG TPA: U32 family peptidase, partial [Myxococcota bacterium]